MAKFGFGITVGGRASGVSGASAPAGIASATVLNDYSIPVTSPAALNALVPLNGRALNIVTNAAASSVDLSKLTGSLVQPGFTTSAVPTTYASTVNFSQRIARPAKNQSQYSRDVNGTDYLFGAMDVAPDQTIFYADTLTLSFAAGFVTGSGAGSLVPTRNDSKRYRRAFARPASPVYRVFRGASNPFDFMAGGMGARSKSLLAALRAFLVDKNGTAGPVSIVSTMQGITYADGAGQSSLVGLGFKTALSTAGLADGPAQIVYQAVPWIGDTIFDSRTFGEAWPTLSPPKTVPCYIDNGNNYTPLYGVVAQSKTGTHSTPAGLYQTAVAAVASGRTFASEAAILLAMKTANNAASGSPQTLGDGTSFFRAIPHNDCDAAVCVVPAVSGSAANFGAASYVTGSYTVTVPFSAQATYPVVNVPVTITTPDGQFNNGIRYTGGAGNTLANKQVARLCDWVGITFDSWAAPATSADNIIISGSNAGIPATQPAASAVVVQQFINCRARGNVASGTSNAMFYQCGMMGFFNHTHANDNTAQGIGNSTGFAGAFSFVGAVFSGCGRNIIPTGLCGVVTINSIIANQQPYIAQPTARGIIMGCVMAFSQANSSPIIAMGGGRPIKDLLTYQVLAVNAGSSTQAAFRVSGDGSIVSMDNWIDYSRTIAGQRANDAYQDQGYIFLLNDAMKCFAADEQINHKSSDFLAPESPASPVGLIARYVAGAFAYEGFVTTDMPAITALSGNGTTVTATLPSGHGVNIGDSIVLTGVTTTTGYNSTFTNNVAASPLVVTAVTATSISWSAATTGAAVVTNSMIMCSSKKVYQAIRDIPAVNTLDSVTIAAAGSGYTYATVTVTGGGASRVAQVNVELSNGKIVGVYITDPGAGYTSNPTLTIVGDGAGGSVTAAACTVAIALTNTAYYVDIGALYGANPFNVAFGERSLRTGNLALRYKIDCVGNVARHSFNDNSTFGTQNNTFGQAGANGTYYGRGGSLKAYTANVGWYKTNVGWNQSEASFGDPSGTNATFVVTTAVADAINPSNNLGNYRPRRIAESDATDSPLINRVPAGFAPLPTDIYGQAYLNNGTDAAGAAR